MATKPKKAAPGREKKVLTLDELGLANYGELHVTLEGTAPLLVHKFSDKAMRMIEEKQQGRAKAARAKAPKDPEQDMLGSMHVIGKRPRSIEELEEKHGQFRYGMPATAFKSALVRMAKINDVMPMTDMRTVVHIVGDDEDRELVEIHTPGPPQMHSAMVRVQQTSDVRYRALFDPWSVNLAIQFHARIISGEQLVSLLVDAGIGNGVGELRPAGRSSSGTMGTWRVTSAEIDQPVLD